MSNFTTLYNTAGLPTGTIVRGRINDPTWLPMNGGLYLKADYPELDTSQYLTFGNNTVQTATGPAGGISYFAHTPNYSSLIVSGATTASYRQSSDGGLTWVTRSIAGISSSIGFIVYVNNMFIAYGSTSSSTFFSTSTDGVTWTSTITAPQVAGGSITWMDFIGGVYVLTGSSSVDNGTVRGILTSANLASGWVARGVTGTGQSGIGSGSVNVAGLNSNFRRSMKRRQGAIVCTQSSTSSGSSNGLGFTSTVDGLNFTNENLGTQASLPDGLNDFEYFTRSYQTLLDKNAARGSSALNNLVFPDLILPGTSVSLAGGNYMNLYVPSASMSGVDRVYWSESRFAVSTYSQAVSGLSYTGSQHAVITPTRAIFFLPSNIYYLNIDNARFRLDAHYMDGRIVDDAYIKAA